MAKLFSSDTVSLATSLRSFDNKIRVIQLSIFGLPSSKVISGSDLVATVVHESLKLKHNQLIRHIC